MTCEYHKRSNIYDLAVDGLQFVGCEHFVSLHMLWIKSRRLSKLSPCIYLILLDTLLLILINRCDQLVFCNETHSNTVEGTYTSHLTWKKGKGIFTFGKPNGRGHETVFTRVFTYKNTKTANLGSPEQWKKPLGLFRVYKGWNTNQFNMDYIIKPSWKKDPVMKQAVFHGKYWGKYPAAFFSWLKWIDFWTNLLL